MAGAEGMRSGPMVLGGFDLAVSIFDTSGLYFGPEGYSNTLTFWLEPSFALGRVWFEGTWFEALSLNGRFPFDVELAGNDSRFRSRSFGASAAFIGAGEQLPLLASTSSGAVEGLIRAPVALGDAWLSLAHGRLVKIPLLDITVSSSARVTLPTSVGSRNAGLIAAPSLGVALDRSFGPVSIFAAARFTKYAFSKTVPSVAPFSSTVMVNGKEEQLWRPESTGIPNPNWGVFGGLSVSLELPKGFSLSASYFLFTTKPFDTSGCAVPGISAANPCADGALVGPSNPTATRDDQWFLASVGYSMDWLTLSLGLGTYRPLRNTDGTIAQPFLSINRENRSTVFLSVTTQLETIAHAVSESRAPTP